VDPQGTDHISLSFVLGASGECKVQTRSSSPNAFMETIKGSIPQSFSAQPSLQMKKFDTILGAQP